jgi:hypothetical protein
MPSPADPVGPHDTHATSPVVPAARSPGGGMATWGKHPARLSY